MSSDVDPRSTLLEDILAGRLSYRLVSLLGVVVVLIVAAPIALLYLRGSAIAPANTKPPELTDPLSDVQDNLSKETDLTTQKNVVTQLNSYVNQPGHERPPGLSIPQRDRLAKSVTLDNEEIAELDSTAFTTLDAHHLELCFLLRDAAQSLLANAAGPSDDASVRLAPLDQATAAFNWVTRQVRLEELPRQVRIEDVPRPLPDAYLLRHAIAPRFVLGRGRGTAMERACIFVELLRQLNADSDSPTTLPACLFVEPAGGPEKTQRVLAVGVAISKDLFLFDPGLGLPIPGPGGKGIATLAEALKVPAVLGQLTVNKDHPYDVTPERLGKADVVTCVSLSALAPRLAYLQKNLLAPAIRVNLAVDLPGEEAAVKAALQTAGLNADSVHCDPQALRALRSLLPVEEGGADKAPFPLPLVYLPGFADRSDKSVVQMWRKQYLELELVPWQGLPGYYRTIPSNSALGRFLRDQFGRPFRLSAFKPKVERDLILRGHYADAIKDLSDERDDLGKDMHQWQREMQAANGEKSFDERIEEFLFKQALHAAADLETASTPEAVETARVRLATLWGENREVNVLLKGSLAVRRRPDVTYLLALAVQEKAEKQQLPLDVAARRDSKGPAKEDAAQRAKDAWRQAADWWRRYADEFPSGAAAPAVRRPRGRCQMELGENRAAIATWENVVEPTMPALEKVGNLYLAERLRKP